MKEEPSEADKLFVLLNGLNDQYDHVINSLEVQPNMTFEQASQHLINHYEKQKVIGKLNKGEDIKLNESLHFTQVKRENKLWCSICKMNNHTNKTCRKNYNNFNKSKNSNDNNKKIKVNQYCKYCVMTNQSFNWCMHK